MNKYRKKDCPSRIEVDDATGDVYLIQTDPSTRAVGDRWLLFNMNECDERKLASAMFLVHRYVYDPEEEKKAVLDVISACRPVMRKLKSMEI
jgi:hypothetical protein